MQHHKSQNHNNEETNANIIPIRVDIAHHTSLPKYISMKKSMYPNTVVKGILAFACFCSFYKPTLAFVPGLGGEPLGMAKTQSSSAENRLVKTTKLAASDNSEEEGSASGTVNPLRLAVLKLGLTELKYTSPLNYEKRAGSYECANCGTKLFDSSGKYDSGSGWPSFWKTSEADRVAYKREWDGRVEVSCKNCGGHLGHAFPDGPKRKDLSEELLLSVPEDDLKTSNPDNPYSRMPRYCVNGASLKFQEQ